MSNIKQDISVIMQMSYNLNQVLDLTLCNPINTLMIVSEAPYTQGEVYCFDPFRLEDTTLLIVENSATPVGFEVYGEFDGSFRLVDTVGINEYVYELIHRVERHDISVFTDRIRYIESLLDPMMTPLDNFSNYVSLLELTFNAKVKHPLLKACECNYRKRELLDLPIKMLNLITFFSHNRGGRVNICVKQSYHNGNYSVPCYTPGYSPATPCREVLTMLENKIWDMEQVIKYLFWGYLHDNKLDKQCFINVLHLKEWLPKFKYPSTKLNQLVEQYISEGSLKCTNKPMNSKVTEALKNITHRHYSETTPVLNDKSE